MQRFFVVIFRDSRIDAKIPAMYAADEIFTGHIPVREQRAAMRAPSAIADALAAHGPRVGHRALVAAAQGLVDGG